MKNLKTYLIILGIVIIIWLLKGWWTPKLIIALGGYVKKEVKTEIVTEYKQGKIDTSAIFNHYVKTKGIILNPKPIIIRDTVIYNPVTKTVEEVDNVKYFKVAIKDSLIDGNMDIYNNFEGDLLATDFTYKPLYPKYITRTDTIIKTITTTEQYDNTYRNKIGLGIGFDNYISKDNYLLSPSILGKYETKNNWEFVGEYSPFINKTNLNIEGNKINTKFGINIIKSW